ncbi:MAG: branched-chain amino acid ABC transporter permease [Infirmifilum sp.]
MDVLSVIFSQLLIGLYRGSIYWLIAAGLTLIFGVLRVVNFAQATLLVLGGYTAYAIYQATSNWVLALVMTPLLVGAIGLAIEVTLLKPIYKIDNTYQLLMTFAVVLILNDVTKVIWGKAPVSIPLPDMLKGSVKLSGFNISLYILIVILIGLLIFISVIYIINRTMWGLKVRAIWRKREIAEALGIKTTTLYSAVFFLGSLFSGLGGALMAMFSPMVPGLGDYLIVYAFIVTVIAGLGNLLGAYISSIIIGVLESVFTYYLPEIDLLLIYLIMAVVLLIKPQGIFGER